MKDEQFDYLYASIKARNEQYYEYKKAEDEQLRARLQQLDLENDQLQVVTSASNLFHICAESTSKCNSKVKSFDLEDSIQEFPLRQCTR